MNFGEKLKAIRTERNMTQEELATLLGTTKQTISRYEKSDREPNLRTAICYAEKLGIDITFLADDSITFVPSSISVTDGASQELQLSSKERSLVLAYRQASPEDRQIIDNIVERYSPTADQHKAG